MVWTSLPVVEGLKEPHATRLHLAVQFTCGLDDGSFVTFALIETEADGAIEMGGGVP